MSPHPSSPVQTEIWDIKTPISVPHVGIIGVDEAGRGAWAGPVVVSAVWWDHDAKCPGLNDSKKLTALSRSRLAIEIKNHALGYVVVAVHAQEVDRVNVLQATLAGMSESIQQLMNLSGSGFQPSVLIDGNIVPPAWSTRAQAIIKGDGSELSIMAASILAKTARDDWMSTVAHNAHPLMEFPRHKGYGVPVHQAALSQHGVTPLHRLTYKPIAALLPKP